MVNIMTNIIKCFYCENIIESKHRHDYVTCKCGKTAVDGGKDYLKRNGDSYVELSQLEFSAVDWWRLIASMQEFIKSSTELVEDTLGIPENKKQAWLESKEILEDTLNQL